MYEKNAWNDTETKPIKTQLGVRNYHCFAVVTGCDQEGYEATLRANEL